MSSYDAIVIGSGPNGLAAAVELARRQLSVLVLEASDTIGGGTRTAELTLPGFRHDVCSAVHPTGVLSPYFRRLPLAEHGLTWRSTSVSVAHPLDGGDAAFLRTSLEETAAALGADGQKYRKLIAPFLRDPHALFEDAMAPLRFPRHPFLLARFGWSAIRSAVGLAARFREPRARALLAGCAAHSIQPLEHPLTAALALIFLIAGHVEPWPVAEGGSAAITASLASYFRKLGGEIRTGHRVKKYSELPGARVVLFDTSPNQVIEIGSEVLPEGYLRRLRNYRYGPGIFKLDWALSGSIPWKNPECRLASTVHLGGTLEEIAAAEAAVWRGEHPERPFVLLCQQSELDPSRAPPGRHTGYAYCHVPAGSDVDLTAIVEAQVERFAPGFREVILARHIARPADLFKANLNYVGGAITGGVNDLFQLFTRPVARFDTYSTPNPKLFICSASTPPGGGVHGMCGYWAAQSALKYLRRSGEASPKRPHSPSA